jgi:hypothetical protein
MALPTERETLLHYFEQIRKRYPTMRNFYSRDKELVLEEDKESGFYRWTSIEPKRVSSGWANPPSLSEAMEQHRLVLDTVPFALSVSPIDCETLNLTYGFDFAYQGNHQELLREALGYAPGLESSLQRPGSRLISADYSMTAAVDDDCRTQFRVHVEPRTTAYQIRAGEFGDEPLSVYLTVRRFGSLEPGDTYVALLDRLNIVAEELLNDFMVDQLLAPIQQAILIK